MSTVQDGKSYIIMNVGTSTVFDLAKGDPGNGTKIQGYELLVKYYDENTNHQVWTAHLQDKDDNGTGSPSLTAAPAPPLTVEE